VKERKEEEKIAATTSSSAPARQVLSNYFQLIKPGIMVLLVLEALTAMVLAEGKNTSLWALGYLAIAGILASGGSAAINQYLERDKDLLMKRTDWRPVANNTIAPKRALAFGVTFILLSLIITQIVFNSVATLMILLGALSYVFLYTLFLKPRTEWNIVIGGIAGVFPALTGWAAATGSIGIPSLFIGFLVFLWTPPHFWGLSMKYKEDYVRTGYPMLPVVKSEKQVINWIVASSVALFVFSFLPLAIPSLGTFGWIYYALDAAVTIPFVYVDLKMLQKPTQDSGFRAFLISLPYMFVLFGAIIASVIL
jgi:protoheme IX farnesyltransferase